MANTENIEAKLCAYVDGELDAVGRAEIEAHLESNPQHRHLMQELVAQRELLRGLPRANAPEDLLESVQGQLERSVLLGVGGPGAPAGASDADEHIAGRINPWPRVFGVAAVLVLALGLASVIFLMIPKQSANFAITGVTPATAPAPHAVPTIEGDLTTRPVVDRSLVAGKGGSEAIVPPAGDLTLADSAAAPATPSVPTPPDAGGEDPFARASGAPGVVREGKSAKSAEGYSNMFQNTAASQTIDAVAVEEQLKQTGGVADNSMLVLVNADNPSAANRQVQDYLSNNKIRWEAVPEPMPQPLDLRDRQVMSGSRAQHVQMRLKDASTANVQQQQVREPSPPQQTAAAGQQSLRGAGAGGGAVASGELSDADALQKKAEVPAASAAPGQRLGADTEVAARRRSADEPASSGTEGPPTPPGASRDPQFSKAAGDASNRSFKSDAAAAEKTEATAESGALADASKQQADKEIVHQKQAASTPPPAAAAVPQPNEAVQAPAQRQQQLIQQAAPLDADATDNAQVSQQQSSPAAPPQQMIIARGLTQQQVLELNSSISIQNGGRVALFQCAEGGGFTPVGSNFPGGNLMLNPANISGATTQPDLAGPATTQPALVEARANGDAYGMNELARRKATTVSATTQPAGVAVATTQPTGDTPLATTAPIAGAKAFDESKDRADGGAPADTAVVTTQPSKMPDGDADVGNDRVDVVIVLQTEPTAVEQQQQPQGQIEAAVQSPAEPSSEPNAAATAPADSAAAPPTPVPPTPVPPTPVPTIPVPTIPVPTTAPAAP